MKYVWPIISVILLISLVGVVAYFLGKQTTDNKTLPNTSPTITTTSQQNNNANKKQTPTPTLNQDKEVIAGGVLVFNKYSIQIPQDWTYTKDESKDISTLAITKNGYKLQILQGGMGGALCLYLGDADFEGPSSRFVSFTQIDTLSGIQLRKGLTEQNSYGICEKQQNDWGQPTSFGAISYTTPGNNQEVILQMDKMLSSLKKL